MQDVGVHAVISLVTYFITIFFSFKAVQAFDFDKFLRRGHTFEAQILLLFTAIAIGFLVGQLIISLIDLSMQLRYLF